MASVCLVILVVRVVQAQERAVALLAVPIIIVILLFA